MIPVIKNPVHVYIAGPFRDTDPAQVLRNVARVVDLARLIYATGHVPVYVHGNALVAQPDMDDKYRSVLAADCSIVRRCDCILMAPGWRDSKGACQEWTAAHHAGLPWAQACDSFGPSLLTPEVVIERLISTVIDSRTAESGTAAGRIRIGRGAGR